MYCPKCLNDTLNISSSGIIKFTFNGKAKATSQLLYNLAQDSRKDLLKKLERVIEDYFNYYSKFQNKDTIEQINAFSWDFVCTNGCVLSVNNQMSIVDIIYTQKEINDAAKNLAKKYKLNVNLED